MVGNAGLGKETIVQLAKHDPKEIFLAARSQSKAEAAIADIKKEVPNSRISFLQLDLTSFKAVEKAANDFNARSSRLDILICNAGIMAVPLSKTEDGYENQFGTNHMGHALLTKLLLPTMLKTAEEPGSDVRVVNLSSSGHHMAPRGGIIYNQDELANWGPWRRYGHSKLANILHARELQRQYPSITATSVHPGVIITDLYTSVNKTNPLIRWGTAAFKGFTTPVDAGSYNTLFAATSPHREEIRSSYYWTPVGKKDGGSFWHARDAKLAQNLWEWTEKEFQKHGY